MITLKKLADLDYCPCESCNRYDIIDYMDNQYAAGFFDADGCVMIKNNRRDKQFPIEANVSNTYFKVLEFFLEKYGGTIDDVGADYRKNTNWKRIWRWRIVNKPALPFLKQILPYLIVKKERVELAIYFWELAYKKHPYKYVSSQKWINWKSAINDSELLELFQKMSFLNKRGLQKNTLVSK